MNKLLISAMVLLLVLWMGILGVFVWSKVEGDFFPVTNTLHITSITPNRSDIGEYSIVAGEFDKLRNCAFQSIEWNYVSGSGRVGQTKVIAFFEDKPQVREIGEGLTFKKLYVRLDEYNLKNNSRVAVYHKCHGDWFWQTRTVFYDTSITDANEPHSQN